jgi:NADH-quinone oxidoreductase subunit F
MAQEYKLILKHADEPGYTPDIECYLRHGGYEDLKKALAIAPKDLPDGKKLSAQEQLREDVKIPACAAAAAPVFLRPEVELRGPQERQADLPDLQRRRIRAGHVQGPQIIHKDPHQLIEGMIISCFANDVKLAYIYIRGEMPEGAKI